jgi:hypothetical protein
MAEALNRRRTCRRASTLIEKIGQSHQTCNPLLPDADSARAKLAVDPRRGVCASRLAVDLLDRDRELTIRLPSLRYLSRWPRVEAGGRHPALGTWS